MDDTGQTLEQFDLVKYLAGVRITVPLQQFVAISPHHRRRLAVSLSTREKKPRKAITGEDNHIQTVQVATEVKRDQPTVDISLNGCVCQGVLMDHGAATNIMVEEVATAIGIRPYMLTKTRVIC